MLKWPKVKVKEKKAKYKKQARIMTKVLNWMNKKVEQDYPYDEALMDLILYGKFNEKRYLKAIKKAVKPLPPARKE